MTPPQPTIPATRFTLRPLRATDAPPILTHAGDKRVAFSTRAIPHPYPPPCAEEFIAQSHAPDREEDVWALDGSAHGGASLLGVIGLKRLGEGRAELGYWIAPAEWGRGLATEAVTALLERNPQGCREVLADAFQDNGASVRVLVKCGFEKRGVGTCFARGRGVEVATFEFVRRIE